jgi:hypothetical protein
MRDTLELFGRGDEAEDAGGEGGELEQAVDHPPLVARQPARWNMPPADVLFHMGKRPTSTPGNNPPAPSAKARQPAEPMTLGNMRSLGPRSLDVTCKGCGHHTTVNVDDWHDETPVPSFGPRMRCKKCGHLGANVRPDWAQLRGVPGTPRR